MRRILPLLLLAAVALTLSAAPAPSTARAIDVLALVPNDAASVGVVRVAELRSSSLLATLFDETDKLSCNGDAEKFLTDAGLDPAKDVDLVVFSLTPREAFGRKADVLVAANGRFNPSRLTAALIARGAVKKDGYLLLPEEKDERPAVAFPSASLALMGTENAVASALKDAASGGTSFLSASGLGRDAGRIDTGADAWAVIDVARMTRLAKTPGIESKHQSAQAVHAALNKVSTVALWATDSGDSLELGAFGLARDEETLQLVEDTVRGALAAMRLAVQEKSPDLVTVLRKFNVTRTSDSVKVTGSIPAETFRNLAAKKHARK